MFVIEFYFMKLLDINELRFKGNIGDSSTALLELRLVFIIVI
jgi:hypothetical protein